MRRERDDAGFSLTELLVVVSIMGIVIAGSYALGFAMTKAAAVAETQAAFTTNVGTPLHLSEKYLQQNSGLEEWNDYRLVCFTDTDIDGFSERVTIQAHPDGRLTLTMWETDAQRVDQTKLLDFTMSEHNVNVANGTPMFKYYDADGVEVATFDARASDTRIVILTVEADYDDTSLEDERQVWFRNR